MSGTRLRLILGKFRVCQIKDVAELRYITLEMGNSVYTTLNAPLSADCREGDLLTLYTEVLYAKPIEPPIE